MYNGLGARKKMSVSLEHFIEENINFSREVKQMEDGGDNSGRSPYRIRKGRWCLLRLLYSPAVFIGITKSGLPAFVPSLIGKKE